MNLLLKELCWVSNGLLTYGDIRILDGIIKDIGTDFKPSRKERSISFSKHFIYPGLINAHDHLEMNLYPRLGNPPYKNYKAWGNDIYKPRESPIKEIEKVDIDLRLMWGGLKNLISGVTSVAHHNPSKRILSSKEFPIKVLKNLAWSHSLGFSKNILKDLPTKIDTPFVIHAAEGVDEFSFQEINLLNQLGLLRKNTVLVHGIALSDADIKLLAETKCALVWCPESNNFLFEKTANISVLKKYSVPVSLGSDSTLTGSSILLDEMRTAHDTGLASAQDIFRMVTSTPAGVFNLNSGNISIGSPADLLITPKLHEDYFENLLAMQPHLLTTVLINGEPRLSQDNLFPLKYRSIINGTMIATTVDVNSLTEKIRKKVGQPILSTNPLWNLIAN